MLHHSDGFRYIDHNGNDKGLIFDLDVRSHEYGTTFDGEKLQDFYVGIEYFNSSTDEMISVSLSANVLISVTEKTVTAVE